jgi:hypothetical protein
VSGYPYALAHGDWFGGKAACFALIDHPKMKIHFFTSHVSMRTSTLGALYTFSRQILSPSTDNVFELIGFFRKNCVKTNSSSIQKV